MIGKENAEHYQWGEQCDGWYLVKRQDMDRREARHFHSRSRQFFFVLSGELTVELGGEQHRLTAQQGLEIPPGEAHQAQNLSAEPVEFLVISHPTTRGDRTEQA